MSCQISHLHVFVKFSKNSKKCFFSNFFLKNTILHFFFFFQDVFSWKMKKKKKWKWNSKIRKLHFLFSCTNHFCLQRLIKSSSWVTRLKESPTYINIFSVLLEKTFNQSEKFLRWIWQLYTINSKYNSKKQ